MVPANMPTVQANMEINHAYLELKIALSKAAIMLTRGHQEISTVKHQDNPGDFVKFTISWQISHQEW